MSEAPWRALVLYAPTPEHALLAGTLRQFVTREVEPQAAEHDRAERFNHALFKRAGELGLLGVILPTEYGGGGAAPAPRRGGAGGAASAGPSRGWAPTCSPCARAPNETATPT